MKKLLKKLDKKFEKYQAKALAIDSDQNPDKYLYTGIANGIGKVIDLVKLEIEKKKQKNTGSHNYTILYSEKSKSFAVTNDFAKFFSNNKKFGIVGGQVTEKQAEKFIIKTSRELVLNGTDPDLAIIIDHFKKYFH